MQVPIALSAPRPTYRFRSIVAEKLRLLKNILSYKELSVITGIPEPQLCKYVKGDVLPSPDRAEILSSKLNGETILNIIKNKIKSKENLLEALLDPTLSKLISFVILDKLIGKRINRLLCYDPFALIVATYLSELVPARTSIIADDALIPRPRKDEDLFVIAGYVKNPRSFLLSLKHIARLHTGIIGATAILAPRDAAKLLLAHEVCVLMDIDDEAASRLNEVRFHLAQIS